MTSTSDPSAPGDPSATILESAATGRFRYSSEEREKMLEAYEASGMSGSAFARHCGIKYPTFAGWVARRRRRQGGRPSATANAGGGFVLAEFSAEPGGEALRIALPGGAVAELASCSQAALLAALIRALA